MTGALKHYLVTLETLPVTRWRLHAYVMTTDKQDTTRVLNKLCDLAERHRLPPFAGLLTELSKNGVPDPESIEIVRNIMREDPEVAHNLDTATDFHASFWFMAKGADKALMELH